MNVSDLRKDFETGVEDVGGFAREVVAKRVAIIAVVTVLVNLAVSYGWVTPTISDDVARWLQAVFEVAAAVAAIAVVRPAVTPVADPRDDSGEKLVPVSDALAAAEKAVNDVRDEYGEIREGNFGNAAHTISSTQAAVDELIQDAKTDYAGVVDPVEHALHPNQAPAVEPQVVTHNPQQ